MAEYKLKIEFTGDPAKPWDLQVAMWNVTVARQDEHIYQARHVFGHFVALLRMGST